MHPYVDCSDMFTLLLVQLRQHLPQPLQRIPQHVGIGDSENLLIRRALRTNDEHYRKARVIEKGWVHFPRYIANSDNEEHVQQNVPLQSGLRALLLLLFLYSMCLFLSVMQITLCNRYQLLHSLFPAFGSFDVEFISFQPL